jgi:ATP-dependent Clp protease adaptor protein ClpS
MYDIDDSIKHKWTANNPAPKLLPAPREKQDDLVEEADYTDTSGEGYRVMLFNDEDHSMEEVVQQVMKALRCPRLDAEYITQRAHHSGRAVVTITDKSEAERIARILREIQLRVQVDHV